MPGKGRKRFMHFHGGREYMSRFVLSYAGPFMALLLVVLGLTGNLFSSDPLIIAGQCAGLALIVWARIAFGRQKFNISARPADGPLLRKGPYRVIRHPMYAGASLLLIMTVIGHLNMFTAAIGILVLIIIPWRIHIEEELLKSTYADYAGYASKTRRLIPFLY
jgi:protein-S-isoprenylcysteine O-methyltransferase Ste14